MANNSIILKRYNKIQIERKASEAIKPGMIVELTSADKVKKHATSGGDVAPLMVAIEDALQGKSKTEAYVADDVVRVWIPQAGDEFLAILADGQNVAIGDKLMSNGLGYVIKHVVEAVTSADAQQANTIYSRPIVGVALEAQDLSGLEGSDSSLEENSQYIRVLVV